MRVNFEQGATKTFNCLANDWIRADKQTNVFDRFSMKCPKAPMTSPGRNMSEKYFNDRRNLYSKPSIKINKIQKKSF